MSVHAYSRNNNISGVRWAWNQDVRRIVTRTSTSTNNTRVWYPATTATFAYRSTIATCFFIKTSSYNNWISWRFNKSIIYRPGPWRKYSWKFANITCCEVDRTTQRNMLSLPLPSLVCYWFHIYSHVSYAQENLTQTHLIENTVGWIVVTRVTTKPRHYQPLVKVVKLRSVLPMDFHQQYLLIWRHQKQSMVDHRHSTQKFHLTSQVQWHHQSSIKVQRQDRASQWQRPIWNLTYRVQYTIELFNLNTLKLLHRQLLLF